MPCDPIKGCPPDTHNLHCGYPNCEKGRYKQTTTPPAAAEEPVRRYDLVGEYDTITMAPMEDGDYVLYSDYAALVATRRTVDHSGGANKMGTAAEEPVQIEFRCVVADGVVADIEHALGSASDYCHDSRNWYDSAPDSAFTTYLLPMLKGVHGKVSTLAARVAELEVELGIANLERDEERIAHSEIASTCFAAGGESADGTSMAAVRSVVAKLATAEQRVAAVEREREAAREVIRVMEEIATEAYAHWDADRNSKVGKYLGALGGGTNRVDLNQARAALAAAAPAPTDSTPTSSSSVVGGCAVLVTGPNQKPNPHPFYGDSWERGLDPFHADAFSGLESTLGENPGSTGPRMPGWFLVDGHGNQIGFVVDGTDVGEPITTGPGGARDGE